MDNRGGQEAGRRTGRGSIVPSSPGDHPGSGLDKFTRSEARRLVFARWLHRQGLLTEWPDLIATRRRPAHLLPATDATGDGGGDRETWSAGANA